MADFFATTLGETRFVAPFTWFFCMDGITAAKLTSRVLSNLKMQSFVHTSEDCNKFVISGNPVNLADRKCYMYI